jgi:2-oxoisovalerate dehydrogenase E2 component (dihydrolipoyl transacylase)
VDIETADGPTTASAPAKATTPSPASAAAVEKKSPGFHDHNEGLLPSSDGKVLTTPAVRKIAKENKINLSVVAGTGPKGRILKEDVLNFIEKGGNAPASTAPATAAASAPTPTAEATTPSTANDVRVPIRGIQRLMVKSMKAAADVPHLTYCEEIIVDNLIAARHQLRDLAKERGVKLSYMPFIIKAAALAIKKYPIINSTVNADCTEFVMHHDVNMGVAMDTPRGLVVPVIKKVNDKSIFDIAAELSSLQVSFQIHIVLSVMHAVLINALCLLQQSASSGTLTEAQLQGGTFTLSNIG